MSILKTFDEMYHSNQSKMGLLQKLIESLPDEDTRKNKAKERYMDFYNANKSIEKWKSELDTDAALELIQGVR